MKLITADEPWPILWAKNPTSGFREPRPIALDFIVGNGLHRFSADNGDKATHLLMGRRGMDALKDYTLLHDMVPDLTGTRETKFMGLTVIETVEDSVQVV